MQRLPTASVAQLRDWAHKLASGGLKPPFSSVVLGLYSHAPGVPELLADLETLYVEAGGGAGAAAALRWLADERDHHFTAHETRLRFVWSGPEGPGARHRDTAVVVRELFNAAHEEVLLVGFAFKQGEDVLSVLHDRMVAVPGLKVTCCLNIPCQAPEVPDHDAVVKAFMADFWSNQWPWQPRIPVYYDPRALAPEKFSRAAMHAKVLVIDRRRVLVTSANFTGQGQHRNIEAGLLVEDEGLARQVCGEFEGLIRGGVLRPTEVGVSQP
jgi:hypothetical protein